MKNFVMAALLLVSFCASSALAGRGHHRGGHHRSDDFGDGLIAGLLLSTATLFFSDLTAHHAEAVYLNADEDAAIFLAEGGEPTPALAQAMNYERNFLARAQVAEAASLNDQQVAYMVMKRAEAL
ncbi:hypothetical protein ACES2L_06420 [Bdellovibrio bacteriovorus]